MVCLKIVFLFSILGMLSIVSSFSGLTSGVFDIISNTGLLSDDNPNSNGSNAACIGRYGNCFYYKGCNLTQQQYAILTSTFLINPILSDSPCAQANGSGQLAFDPATQSLILNVNIDNLSAYPENNETGFCDCTVCNEPCGDIFVNRCNNTNTGSSQQKYQMLSPSTTIPILGGSGGVCFTSSKKTYCLALVFCGVNIEVLGNEIDLGNLQFFCAQGELSLSVDNNGPTFGLSNVQITTPSNGICTCTACAAPCGDNPLLGCPKNKTHCPQDKNCYSTTEKQCSTTEKQHCKE